MLSYGLNPLIYIDTGGGKGYTRSVTREEIYISVLPRVLSGHGTKSSILYLHSPTVRPKYIVRQSEDPLIQDSLSRKYMIIAYVFGVLVLNFGILTFFRRCQPTINDN